MLDVIPELGEHILLGQVGLDDEEDFFIPMVPGARHRAVSLALNLLRACTAAWVIGLFEQTPGRRKS